MNGPKRGIESSSCGETGRRLRPWSAPALCAALLAPSIAPAQLALTTAAVIEHQESSNIFDLSPGAAPATANGDTQRSDSFTAYGGSLTSTYGWGRQNLTFIIDGHEYRYEHFTGLDHDEYKVSGDWEWQAGSIFDGTIGVTRNRQMVAFSSFVGTALSVQTNQVEHASMNIRVMPEWRIETGASSSNSDSPRPGMPNLSLREDTGTAALRYTGYAGLSTGISGRYTDGSYSGADTTLEPSYHESAAQVVATYSLNPTSNFDFAAGYTRRQSTVAFDRNSGFTGLVSYQRHLTGKTSFKLQLSRSINSYITNTGSEIDSAATFTLSWQATHKIAVSSSYSYTYSELPRQGLNNADRLDHFRIAQLNFDYRPRNWLELQPYARWETRTSDTPGAPYSASVYGISATVRWQNEGRR